METVLLWFLTIVAIVTGICLSPFIILVVTCLGIAVGISIVVFAISPIIIGVVIAISIIYLLLVKLF